jgi:hypothetical protein
MPCIYFSRYFRFGQPTLPPGWVAILLAGCLMCTASCQKDRPPAKFEMRYHNLQIEIPAGLSEIESSHFIIRDIPTDASRYLQDNNLTASEITAVVPHFLRLTNTQSSASYNFIYEISVRLFNSRNPDRSFEIFYYEGVPLRTGDVLDLIPNENDMKEIMLGDRFSLDIVLKRLRQSPTEFIQTRVELGFDAR